MFYLFNYGGFLAVTFLFTDRFGGEQTAAFYEVSWFDPCAFVPGATIVGGCGRFGVEVKICAFSPFLPTVDFFGHNVFIYRPIWCGRRLLHSMRSPDLIHVRPHLMRPLRTAAGALA